MREGLHVPRYATILSKRCGRAAWHLTILITYDCALRLRGGALSGRDFAYDCRKRLFYCRVHLGCTREPEVPARFLDHGGAIWPEHLPLSGHGHIRFITYGSFTQSFTILVTNYFIYYTSRLVSHALPSCALASSCYRPRDHECANITCMRAHSLKKHEIQSWHTQSR